MIGSNAACPFCGREDGQVMNTVEGELRRYWVYCLCGGSGPFAYCEAEAVALWNSRSPSALLISKVQEA